MFSIDFKRKHTIKIIHLCTKLYILFNEIPPCAKYDFWVLSQCEHAITIRVICTCFATCISILFDVHLPAESVLNDATL